MTQPTQRSFIDTGRRDLPPPPPIDQRGDVRCQSCGEPACICDCEDYTPLTESEQRLHDHAMRAGQAHVDAIRNGSCRDLERFGKAHTEPPARDVQRWTERHPGDPFTERRKGLARSEPPVRLPIHGHGPADDDQRPPNVMPGRREYRSAPGEYDDGGMAAMTNLPPTGPYWGTEAPPHSVPPPAGVPDAYRPTGRYQPSAGIVGGITAGDGYGPGGRVVDEIAAHYRDDVRFVEGIEHRADLPGAEPVLLAKALRDMDAKAASAPRRDWRRLWAYAAWTVIGLALIGWIFWTLSVATWEIR